MTDVERFFRRLVSSLAAADPARLRQPVALDEIIRDLVPYRTNRRALGLETSEDYELVLLRLCAGEGNLVRTQPEEARERFAQEVRSTIPDLEALHSFEQVQLTLAGEAVTRALEAEIASTPELVLGVSRLDLGAALGAKQLRLALPTVGAEVDGSVKGQ